MASLIEQIWLKFKHLGKLNVVLCGSQKALVIAGEFQGQVHSEQLAIDLDTGQDDSEDTSDMGDSVTGYLQAVIFSANKACKVEIISNDDGDLKTHATFWTPGNETVPLFPKGAWQVEFGSGSSYGKFRVHVYNLSGVDELKSSTTFIYTTR